MPYRKTRRNSYSLKLYAIVSCNNQSNRTMVWPLWDEFTSSFSIVCNTSPFYTEHSERTPNYHQIHARLEPCFAARSSRLVGRLWDITYWWEQVVRFLWNMHVWRTPQFQAVEVQFIYGRSIYDKRKTMLLDVDQPWWKRNNSILKTYIQYTVTSSERDMKKPALTIQTLVM